ncbi:uncharacterized protein [Venturia canescens]|uniref:uncharacterized protein n=1 Tax=Venturia canescens TaxID=32260 RepID=UPI001C9C12FD|nr:uncharacterized protein LOC122417809 [Venturia canescens]
MKRYETNLTSMTIRKRLYNIEYIPTKEKAAEFWDRFEELVRNYDSLPNVNPLSHDEKRDAFFNAITTAIPQVQSIDFVTTNSTGKGLTYDQLKAFIIQHEANKTQTDDTKPAALSIRKHDSKNRCYGCGGQGHHADECPHEGKPQCYECGKIGHIARECTIRKNKQSESATSSKYRSSSKHHSKNAHRPMNSSSFRGKRKFGGSNRENSAKRAKVDKGRSGQQKNKDQRNQDDGKENQNGSKMRKDMGLSIYMDNQQIDIFDPTSHESLIKEIYQKPFWKIELEVDKTSGKFPGSNESKTKRSVAYLTTESSENETRYMTRSVAKAKDVISIDEDPISTKFEAQNKATETEKISLTEVSKTSVPENEKTSLNGKEGISEIVTPSIQNFNSDLSIWDRKLGNVEDIQSEEFTSDETPFNERYEKFLD